MAGFAAIRLGARLFALALLFLATSALAAELTFDLRIARGRVPDNMRLVRVKQGDVVKLRWSTDKPVTLHLHGYDIQVKVEPGAVAEMAFTARATGRFAVEVHVPNRGSSSQSHGETPLVRIEVYPK